MSTKTLSTDEVVIPVTVEDAPVPDTEVLRLLEARGTVRNLKKDPIPRSWIDALVRAGQRAPTSSNIQAYTIIEVHEPATRRKLAEIAGGQQHIIDCPVYFALCADLNRLARAHSMHNKEYPGRTFETGLVSSIDAALVGMSMTLAADSMGLASVMIGAMRNNAVEVARTLKLPPRVYVVFGLCIGWPEKKPLPKPRQPLSTVLHQEFYDGRNDESGIKAYDQELADYYRRRGVDSPDQAWSQFLSERFAVDKRKRLRQELNELGFPLE